MRADTVVEDRPVNLECQAELLGMENEFSQSEEFESVADALEEDRKQSRKMRLKNKFIERLLIPVR